MPEFYAKGYEGKVIHGSHSPWPLQINGSFQFSGPQPVNESGGAPVWVAEKFEECSDLDQIALSGGKGSVVWSRIKE